MGWTFQILRTRLLLIRRTSLIRRRKRHPQVLCQKKLLLLKTQNNKKLDIHVNQIEGLCSSKKFIIDLKRKYYLCNLKKTHSFCSCSSFRNISINLLQKTSAFLLCQLSHTILQSNWKLCPLLHCPTHVPQPALPCWLSQPLLVLLQHGVPQRAAN